MARSVYVSQRRFECRASFDRPYLAEGFTEYIEGEENQHHWTKKQFAAYSNPGENLQVVRAGRCIFYTPDKKDDTLTTYWLCNREKGNKIWIFAPTKQELARGLGVGDQFWDWTISQIFYARSETLGWNCLQCTFQNEMVFGVCESCGTKQPEFKARTIPRTIPRTTPTPIPTPATPTSTVTSPGASSLGGIKEKPKEKPKDETFPDASSFGTTVFLTCNGTTFKAQRGAPYLQNGFDFRPGEQSGGENPDPDPEHHWQPHAVKCFFSSATPFRAVTLGELQVYLHRTFQVKMQGYFVCVLNIGEKEGETGTNGTEGMERMETKMEEEDSTPQSQSLPWKVFIPSEEERKEFARTGKVGKWTVVSEFYARSQPITLPPRSTFFPTTASAEKQTQEQERERERERWSCLDCTFMNRVQNPECEICGKARPVQRKLPSTSPTPQPTKTKTTKTKTTPTDDPAVGFQEEFEWECPKCTFRNSGSGNCLSCELETD